MLVTIAIILSPILYDLLFPGSFIKDSYYWVAVAIILMTLIDEASNYRLTEIQFDMDKREIIFNSSTIFSSSKKDTLAFDNAGLEIVKSRSKFKWLSEPMVLYFLKNKTEIIEIKRSKDGFSVDTMKEIIGTVEKLSLPAAQ